MKPYKFNPNVRDDCVDISRSRSERVVRCGCDGDDGQGRKVGQDVTPSSLPFKRYTITTTTTTTNFRPVTTMLLKDNTAPGTVMRFNT